jgi:PAS domain-containing protein
MSKALILRLAPWLAGAAAIAPAAALAASTSSGLATTALVGGASITALCLSFYAVRRVLVSPVDSVSTIIEGFRAHSGPLPKELPIHRPDEIGRLARGVALLAGDRNASEMLREESDSKAAALTDAISDAIFRIDRDGVILDHQRPRDVPSFVDVDEPRGSKLKEIFPPSVTDRAVDALANVFVTETPQQFDFQLERRGATRHASLERARTRCSPSFAT